MVYGRRPCLGTAYLLAGTSSTAINFIDLRPRLHVSPRLLENFVTDAGNDRIGTGAGQLVTRRSRHTPKSPQLEFTVLTSRPTLRDFEPSLSEFRRSLKTHLFG